MKKLSLMVIAIASLTSATHALAQGMDLAFGVSTVTSAQTVFNTSSGLYYPSLRGGAYPGFSADFLMHRSLGIEGELFWRASQGLYGLQPYRPIFWNFNAIWAPRIGKHFAGELVGGIGATDTRFYGLINYSPFSGYTNYVSSTHFDGDFGAGLRAYFWHGAFLRPEVRLYLIHNNTAEFSSNEVLRYGVSLGYSFGR
ncbi:MAG TPA: hypothetical protein VEK33_15965 [Terriglobales bacterium]|nr:hypothetical protein [Terriglobales bacterium]